MSAVRFTTHTSITAINDLQIICSFLEECIKDSIVSNKMFQKRKLKKQRNKILKQLSRLAQLISSCNWEGVCDRLATHPQEATELIHIKQNEILPLHLACFYNQQGNDDETELSRFCPKSRPTTRVLKSLIQAYPDAACMRDYKGRTPLCLFLLSTFPFASSDEESNHNNDDDAIKYNTVEQIKELLKPNPKLIAMTAISDEESHKTPLMNLFEHYAMEIAECEISLLRFQKMQKSQEQEEKKVTKIEPSVSFGSWWEECVLLIRAAFDDTVDDDDQPDFSGQRKFYLVHACCSLLCRGMCPLQLLRLALMVYPEQVQIMEGKESTNNYTGNSVNGDERRCSERAEDISSQRNTNEEGSELRANNKCNGNLPLHQLVSAPSFPPSEYSKISCSYIVSAQHEERFSSRYSHKIHYAKQLAAEAVLDLYPQAASIKNCRGKTPLVLAIDAAISKQGWCTEKDDVASRYDDDNYAIQRLLNAAPQIVSVVDVDTGLYPFMLAATGAPPETNTVEKYEKIMKQQALLSQSTQRHDVRHLKNNWITSIYLLLRTDPSVIQICTA